jgi:hypothetical protein
MGYDKYAAHFVMLEGQSNVFALRTTMPVKGHIKIETGNGKGAMRVVAQNMRYYEKGPYIYKLILFGKKKERTIYKIMETININKNGSGETYIRFNPFDIDGKGNKLSAYNAAIIVAASIKNEKESLHPVLKGEIITGDTDAEITMEEMEEESFMQEMDFAEEDKLHMSEGNGIEEAPRLRRIFNNFYNRFLMESCDRCLRKARYYDDIKPFKMDKTRAEWKKIIHVGNIPLVSPGAHYFATKYRHYIFGIAEKRCYIGIPGRLMKEEQPDGGESGFVYWQPIVGASHSDDAYGYWIAAINLTTGDIEEV